MVSITKLEQLLGNDFDQRKPPPLEKWDPPFCGSMPLKIDAAGQWWHNGTIIRREKMINLFARVLWREEDAYYLKTPVEKVLIEVEDVPLLVNQLEEHLLDDKNYLILKTMQGDHVVIGEDNVPFMRLYKNELRPYIRVRRNIEALIHRNTFYHLLALGEFFDCANGVAIRIKSGDYEFELLDEGGV